MGRLLRGEMVRLLYGLLTMWVEFLVVEHYDVACVCVFSSICCFRSSLALAPVSAPVPVPVGRPTTPTRNPTPNSAVSGDVEATEQHASVSVGGAQGG